MTERERDEALPPDEEVVGGGAMTGATGNLTPPEATEPFVPGEAREASGPGVQGGVTTTLNRESAALHAADHRAVDRGLDEGDVDAFGGGYGTGAGLAPGDPAYRMEQRPMPPRAEAAASRSTGRDDDEPSLGGDVRIRPEDDRL